MSKLADACHVTDLLSYFLKKLKKFNKDFTTIYYITGIFTVPNMKVSITNGNTNLTHHPAFALTFGLTKNEVTSGLREIGVTDKIDLQWAHEFLKENADGYHFFSCCEDIFNPQLVQVFFKNYAEYKRERLAGEVVILEDENQRLTANQLRIINHSPDLMRCMIKACVQNESFSACITTKTTISSPATYLYQLGVLSLTKYNVKHRENKQFELQVPNLFTRHDYAHAFPETKIGTRGTCTAFFANPKVDTLRQYLNNIMRNLKHLTNEQSEADLSHLFASHFFLESTAVVKVEHHAGDDTGSFVDVSLISRERNLMIFIEFKTVKAQCVRQKIKSKGYTFIGNPSQTLVVDDIISLELQTFTERQEYPKTGLAILNELELDQLLRLRTKYNGRISSVHDIHKSGENRSSSMRRKSVISRIESRKPVVDSTRPSK